MSLGEVSQISEGIYAYLQPDGSWWLNNTAILGTPMPPAPGIWTDVDWGNLEPAPPFLTYTDGVMLWSGDLRCEVRYVGTPRTPRTTRSSTSPNVPWSSPATCSSTAAPRSR